MPRVQLGICAEGNLHSSYLLFNHLANTSVEQQQLQLGQAAKLIHGLAEAHSDYAFNGFVAIGSEYWSLISPCERPRLLRGFPTMQCDDRHAPKTDVDVFITLRADRYDLVHLICNQLVALLSTSFELLDDTRGFRYLDNRDITGFVDGTENPKGNHRQEVALVDDDTAIFCGGSYLHIQKYHHKMQAWNRLDDHHQQQIIGRTKHFNVELSEQQMPIDAHVNRTSIKGYKGQPLEILRQSMPFGNCLDQGLYFISLCKTPEHFEKMLYSMIYGEQGHFDKILDFSEASTGAAFFVPSLSWFETRS
ncbi:Dyp-type peroxidase [Paraferrimonas sp. SM1919]|uniref:Dyp-type peroxidase n=1 Tax=Paraferrimonas sp. SM1919 TaxID=2662263 RepID=UPI0013D39CFC|nr:Dyp-type peroxidase [Paraferrimonas sp. SM1919]